MLQTVMKHYVPFPTASQWSRAEQSRELHRENPLKGDPASVQSYELTTKLLLTDSNLHSPTPFSAVQATTLAAITSSVNRKT